jgi:hypothetical protein
MIYRLLALTAATLLAGACSFSGADQAAEPLTTPPTQSGQLIAPGEPWTTAGTAARQGPITQQDIDLAIKLLEVLSQTESGADPEAVMRQAGFPPGRGVYATSRISLIYQGLLSNSPVAMFQMAGSPESEYPTPPEIDLVRSNKEAIDRAQARYRP